MEKLISFIESKRGVILFLLLSLSSMIVHTAMVYYIEDGEHWYDILFSLSFSIAFDIAVIYFVLRGNLWIPYFLSACQVYMNYLHYDQMAGKVTNAAIFLSFVLPFIIAAFSHDIHKRKKEEKEKEETDSRLREERDIAIQMQKEYLKDLEEKIEFLSSMRKLDTESIVSTIQESDLQIVKLFEKQEEFSKFVDKATGSINRTVMTLNGLSEVTPENKKHLFHTSKDDIL